MATRMLQRRGTLADWAAANPILSPGEIGFVTDARVIKIGDGVTAWTSLLPMTVDKANDADLLDGINGEGYLLKGDVQEPGVSRNTRNVATLNANLLSGWYDINSATGGAPTGDWWLVLVIAHANNAGWQRQIAFSMNGEPETQSVYSRRLNGLDATVAANWSAWSRVDSGGKAADSNLLDGLDSTAFLRTDGKAADSDKLDGLDSSAFMTTVAGTVNMFAGVNLPAGWLWANGDAILRSEYTNLFNAIGTTYGAGDGTTTFNLPNLKGRVPVGQDALQPEFDVLGESGGSKAHTLTSDEMPTHTHVQDAHNHIQNPHSHDLATRASSAAGTAAPMEGSVTGSGSTKATIASTPTNQEATATNQNTGGGLPHNNLQPYIVMNYIIKV